MTWVARCHAHCHTDLQWSGILTLGQILDSSDSLKSEMLELTDHNKDLAFDPEFSTQSFLSAPSPGLIMKTHSFLPCSFLDRLLFLWKHNSIGCVYMWFWQDKTLLSHYCCAFYFQKVVQLLQEHHLKNSLLVDLVRHTMLLVVTL